MKKIIPVFTAILFWAFIITNLNASTNKTQNKNTNEKGKFSLEKFCAEHQKDVDKFRAELKSRSGGKTKLTLDEMKSIAEKYKNQNGLNKSASKKRVDYAVADAMDNDGWLATFDFDKAYDATFNTTQSMPMTIDYDINSLTPVWGGTTVKYGFQLLTTTSDFFLVKLMGVPVTGIDSPELTYFAIDIAYDIQSDIVYILYQNGYFVGGDGIVGKTSAGKPAADGRPYGYYIGAYRLSLESGLDLLPLGDLVRIYPAPSAYVSDWAILYEGLACSRDGQLYTVNHMNKQLCAIDKLSGTVTPVGELDIPFLDPGDDIDNYIGYEFINLEFDYKTDNLYLVDAKHRFGGGGGGGGLGARNVVNSNGGGNEAQGDPPPVFSRSQLYRVNPQNADVTLLTDGSVHNYLWTDGEGTDQDHFITGFTIPQSGIILSSPSIGSVLFAGEVFPIIWIGIRINYSNIAYSTDNGTTWQPIANNVPVSGFMPYGMSGTLYEWKVPYNLPRSIIIRVTDAENSLVFDQRSAGVHDMHIISPNGGENWPINSLQTISWYSQMPVILIGELSKKSSDYSLPVDISYTTNGIDWTLIASGVPSKSGVNTFPWFTPTVTGNTYQIMISESYFAAGDNKTAQRGDPIIYSDMSDGCFSLFVAPSNGDLVITSPNGGEILQGGTYQYITWKRVGGVVRGTFLLEYSSDGGNNWKRINNSPIAGVMRYNWLVPQMNSTHCLVRITNYLSPKMEYDRSDNEFTVKTSTIAEAKNFPNPFNPTTKIVFGLEKSSFTSLKVYNSIGQQVAELVNKQLEAGMHEYEFNASNLPSGVYFYNLKRDDKTEIHKMLLLK